MCGMFSVPRCISQSCAMIKCRLFQEISSSWVVEWILKIKGVLLSAPFRISWQGGRNGSLLGQQWLRKLLFVYIQCTCIVFVECFPSLKKQDPTAFKPAKQVQFKDTFVKSVLRIQTILLRIRIRLFTLIPFKSSVISYQYITDVGAGIELRIVWGRICKTSNK